LGQIPVITGSVMVVFSMFMTSLCTEYYQFFLAQGLALGLGISLVILPAFAVVPRIFVASRGLALGIVVSGSSLGGVIWPIALQRLFKEVGFGWAVRIIAFIMLPLLAFACVVIRIPGSKSSKSGPRPSPDLSVIKHPVLILLSTALFFVYLGLFAPLFYLTGWTISLGLDADMAFYMVSIANGASLFGRVLPGLMADRLGPFNIMIICTLLSSIVCMAWTAATSMVGIIFISLAYGFGSGAVIGLQGVCASQVVKASEYGIAMGFIMSILSIA
jgi:predicted MFS family arabinose efflux permease